jgi:hypothetical protein
MGNITAKRTSKKERESKKENRNKALNKRKNEIEEIEKSFYNNTITKIKNGEYNDENVLVIKEFTTKISLLSKSKEQLSRGGGPLTKADLIAIICFIEPNYLYEIDEIKEYTIEDLNAIIRIVIYNPSRMINNTENNQYKMIDY